MISPIMYVILSFVPAGILSLMFEIWQRISHVRSARASVTDKLLRPPGESCRRKMELLDDKIGELSIWIIGFPATLLLCYLSSSGTDTPSRPKVWVLAVVAAAIILGGLVWRMIVLIKQRDEYRRGFSGERAVGEQLNQLMCDGCRVFHDFPLDEGGNISHVVVSPSGVFTIQTRFKRKGAASETQQAHEVIYDGKSLEYPYQSESADLNRSRHQAAQLEKFLNPHLHEQVGVQPVLTLPGWFVIYRALGDVIVLNPKMLDAAILSPSATNLSPERIKEISRLLDQKCRDVEF